MANWTVMIYMNADYMEFHDKGTAEADIEEMVRIGSSDEVNVMLLYDRFQPLDKIDREPYKPKIYKIEKDVPITETEELLTLPFEDMGNPKTLQAFMKFCVDNSPAEHYALVIWDHGSGFFSFGGLGTEMVSRDGIPDTRIKPERNFGASSLYYPGMKRQTRIISRNMHATENTVPVEDHHLYPSEIADVIKEIFEKKYIDLLIYDACWMQSFENAYALKSTVKYLIASENTLTDKGMNYTKLLRALKNATADSSTAEICTTIIDSVFNSMQGETYFTLSAMNLELTNNVADAIDNLTLLFKNSNLAQSFESIRKARMLCMNFYYDENPSFGLDSIDLVHFLKLLAEILRSKIENQTELDNLLKGIKQTIDVCKDFIVHNRVTEDVGNAEDDDGIRKVWGASGFSIFFPDNPFTHQYYVNNKDWYYDRISRVPFAKRKWKLFIREFMDSWCDNYMVVCRKTRVNRL